MVNNETIELMGFVEFLETIKESVKEVIGEQYNVDISHVIKNNSIELDGLIILRENERITPNIYLNSYYEKYLGGDSVEEMVEEIVGIYMNTMEDGEKESFGIQYEFNEMKSCIIYRLVNYDKNKKLLHEVPHFRFLDLAVTFHCLVKNSEDGIGMIRITNEHLKSWNTDLEELKEIAKTNTPNIFPSVVKNMNEVILDIFKKDIQLSGDSRTDLNETCKEFELSAEDLLEEMLTGMGEHRSADMYVVSNTKGINGASCLLYPTVIKNLADQLSTDFYILPSSIHEIILVKDNGQLNKNLLNEMVQDVNRTQVPEEEILSNSVYFYSHERDLISM